MNIDCANLAAIELFIQTHDEHSRAHQPNPEERAEKNVMGKELFELNISGNVFRGEDSISIACVSQLSVCVWSPYTHMVCVCVCDV